MTFFSSKAGSSGNHKLEVSNSAEEADNIRRHHYSRQQHQDQEQENQKFFQPPSAPSALYDQTVSRTARSEARTSRRVLGAAPRLPSSHYYSDHPPSSSPLESAPSMILAALRPSHMHPHPQSQSPHQSLSSSRKSSVTRQESFTVYSSSRSDSSSVTSSSAAGGSSRSRRAASNPGGWKEPPMPTPPRSSTMPNRTPSQGHKPVSRISSRSTTTSEGASQRSSPSHVPTHAESSTTHPIYQMMTMRTPSSHSNSFHSNTRPHMSSGNLSEGGAVTSMDMKRLLSKPALPFASNTTGSASSLTHSDSEVMRQSHTGGVKSRSESEGARAAKSEKGFGRVSQPVMQHSTSSPENSSPNSASPRTSSLRHILKRRPSAPRSPDTPLSAKSAPAISAGSPSSRQPASYLTIDSALSRRVGGHRGDTSRSTSSRSTSSSPLTPAGAVAEAYKLQEQKRDNLSLYASGSGEDDTPRVGAKTFSDSGRPSPVPSYIGGTSGRVVAVGGPGDLLLEDYASNPQVRSPKAASPRRSLSRKVSARWKKATSGRKGDYSPEDADLEARPSTGRRSASLPRERTMPFGRSIDLRSPPASSHDTFMSSAQNHASAKAWSPGVSEEDVRSRPAKLVKARGDREKEKEREDDGGKIWKLMKRISTNGLRDKYQVDKAPPVPSLPKDLAARSAQQSMDGNQSGVLSQFMQSRSSMSATPTALHRFDSPRSSPRESTSAAQKSSLFGQRPSTATGSSSPVSSDFASSQFFHRTHSTGSSASSYGDETHSRAPPVPKTQVGQHIIPPSELYRMNLDIESDPSVTKPRNPHRTMSAPGRDALPPPEHSPEAMRPSLPYPPRRPNTAGSQNSPRHYVQSSPEIPVFSNADTINTFNKKMTSGPSINHDDHARPLLSLQMPQSEFGLSLASPPPRPSKNPRRPRLGSASVSSSTLSPSPTKTPLSDDSPDNSESRNINRKSSGAVSSASTARQRSSTFHFSSSSSSTKRPTTGDSSATQKRRSPTGSSMSPERSPLQFREMVSPSAKTPLTAKEKADIWDDLLEKSERAGGTIHMGGSELMSDQMRFESRLSNYTDITEML